MNLILCGMMGSGKTTIGIKIAQRTGKSFVDTDTVIEERYGKIPDIFARYGEEYFRGLEREIVQELSVKEGLIISTGGGLVLCEKNVNALQKNGKIVFLRASLETLSHRLSADSTRPMLQSATESVTARIAKLLEKRTPVYEKAASYVVDVDNKSVDEIANEIIKLTQNEENKGAGTR